MTDPTAREPIEAMVDTMLMHIGVFWDSEDAATVAAAGNAMTESKAALLAAISALRRDAERYRWLRQNSHIALTVINRDVGWIAPDDIDAIIDGDKTFQGLSREAPHG